MVRNKCGVTSGTLDASLEHPLPHHDPSSPTPPSPDYLFLPTQAPPWCLLLGQLSLVPPTRLGPPVSGLPLDNCVSCLLPLDSELHSAPSVFCFQLFPGFCCVPRCLLKAASISPYSGPHSISLLWNVEAFHHYK